MNILLSFKFKEFKTLGKESKSGSETLTVLVERIEPEVVCFLLLNSPRGGVVFVVAFALIWENDSSNEDKVA